MSTGSVEAHGVRGRIAAALSGSRDLIRIAYRDPEHVSERVTLYAAQKLGAPSIAWAEAARRARPDVDAATLAEELRTQSAKVARIDGAIAGTPFFIALVPGYLNYLWQEARMSLRIAALYGRDPAAASTSAEMLALRGVHPTVDAAEAALVAVRSRPAPEKPEARRSLRTWVGSGYRMLVFGGFLSAPAEERPAGARSRLRAAAGLLIGGVIWVTTWVLPVTFMLAMSWACEAHTRQLGSRVLAFYGGEDAMEKAAAERRDDPGRGMRQALRGLALGASVAIPIAFVAYINHVHQSVGVNWLGAIGALVALSLVIATAVVASRR